MKLTRFTAVAAALLTMTLVACVGKSSQSTSAPKGCANDTFLI